MAKFSANEADNYGGQGNGSFFGLKNDKDTAVVRFMYNTLEDIEGYAVHEIELDGKKRYVNCLREYNEPLDNCPLCAARYKVLAKLFVMVYDVDADEVKVWDRGKTFLSKLSSLCARYNPLVATPFEIERNGKKGDTNTTYETYAMQTDEITLEDLPELPELLGTLILDKTVDELNFFLDYGDFPSDRDESEAPPERNPERDRKPAAAAPAGRAAAPAGRRTPAAGAAPAGAPAQGSRRAAAPAAPATSSPATRRTGRTAPGDKAF